jgi:hypothetical protein
MVMVAGVLASGDAVGAATKVNGPVRGKVKSRLRVKAVIRAASKVSVLVRRDNKANLDKVGHSSIAKAVVNHNSVRIILKDRMGHAQVAKAHQIIMNLITAMNVVIVTTVGPVMTGQTARRNTGKDLEIISQDKTKTLQSLPASRKSALP